MKYSEAKTIADNLIALLAPYCERIEIAGSLRRLKSSVGDIEIVCVSKTAKLQDDLFGGGDEMLSLLPRAGLDRAERPQAGFGKEGSVR